MKTGPVTPDTMISASRVAGGARAAPAAPPASQDARRDEPTQAAPAAGALEIGTWQGLDGCSRAGRSSDLRAPSSPVGTLLVPPPPPPYAGVVAELAPALQRVQVTPAAFDAIEFGRSLQVGGEITSWLRAERIGPDGSRSFLPHLFSGPANVFSPAEPVFEYGKFDDKGQVMDSVEPARHWPYLRAGDEPPYFWLVGRLGMPGKVRFIEVSTEFHDGNHAQSVELFLLDHRKGKGEPAADDPGWVRVTPRTACDGHSRMLFAVDPTFATHVKVHDHPDGGISRVKLYEEATFRRDPAIPEPPTPGRPWLTRSARPIDKSAAERSPAPELPAESWGAARNLLEGAKVVFSTDSHYSRAEQVLKRGPAANMGDGWENSRKYKEGNAEFLVIEAAAPIQPRSVLLDMRPFKLNNPVFARVIALDLRGGPAPEDREGWEAVAGTPLTDHWVRVKDYAGQQLVLDTTAAGATSHLMVAVAPCGGLARVRAFDVPAHGLDPSFGLKTLSLTSPVAARALVAGSEPTAAPREILAEPLSPEAFRPFGQVVADGIKEGRPANEGTAIRTDWLGDLVNDRPWARGNFSVFECQATELPFDALLLERHPKSSQAFLPMGPGKYLVIVAPSAPDGEPDVAGIRAFIAGPEQAINYAPGTWHHSIRALQAPMKFWMIAWEDQTAGDCETRPLEKTPIQIVLAPGALD